MDGTGEGSLGAGRVLVVCGPDGSGKSRLCEAIAREVLQGRPVRHIHHRPGVLPRWNSSNAVTEPHRNPPYMWPVSVGKIIFLFADFVLGWTLFDRPFLRRGGWLVMERGWWDIAVDPRRYRLTGGRGLAMLLGRLLPAPDLVLVLEASPTVLTDRKPELPEIELARQMNAWHEVLPRRTRRKFLDASLPFRHVLNAAITEIDRLGSRDDK